MTNEQERVKKAIDSTLGGLEDNPQLTARVLAARETKPEQRRHASWGLVLAAVMLLGMAAFAAAGGSRYVNWLGEPSPTEQVIDVSYDVEPDVLARILREDDIEESYLRASDEPLMFRITWPEGGDVPWDGSTSQIRLYVDDMAHFAHVMADAPYFPVPQWIPDGYEFVNGSISYAYKPDGEMTLFATDVTEDGLTVERYRASEEGQIFPYFYVLVFQHGDETLMMGSTLSADRDPAEYTFTVEDGREARALIAPQYDNVLFTEHNDRNILWIRNDLDAELPYREPWSGEIKAYRDVIVSIDTIGAAEQSRLDAETLLRIFTGE